MRIIKNDDNIMPMNNNDSNETCVRFTPHDESALCILHTIIFFLLYILRFRCIWRDGMCARHSSIALFRSLQLSLNKQYLHYTLGICTIVLYHIWYIHITTTTTTVVVINTTILLLFFFSLYPIHIHTTMMIKTYLTV